MNDDTSFQCFFAFKIAKHIRIKPTRATKDLFWFKKIIQIWNTLRTDQSINGRISRLTVDFALSEQIDRPGITA